MPIRQKSLVLDTIPTIELFPSVQAVSGMPPTTATKHKHEFTYNADGSLDTRYRIDALESGGAHSYKRTSESFDYTYNSLIYEYTSSASYARSGDEGCFDMNNDTYLRWRYRYSPSGEREQKRLVALPNSNSGYPYSLNRSYYLLGGGNRQHAIYEGRQHIFNGPLCQGGASLTGSAVVWAPSEYLMYAGGGTPLVTFLPNGNKEYKILDHLGNTRAIVGSGGSIITEKDYEPFGKTISGVPTLMDNSISPRQGFIGKEFDSESDLADHGVRKYDYITGRFMAVDPLWEKYRNLNTYQYAANNPIVAIDKGGDSVSVLISGPAFLNFEGETGSNGLVGHVALNIDGAIYSFEGNGQWKEYKYDTYIQSEHKNRYIAELTVSVDQTKVNEALKGIKNGTYDVTKNSCVTNTISILRAGGIPFNTPNGAVTPESLVKSLQGSGYVTNAQGRASLGTSSILGSILYGVLKYFKEINSPVPGTDVKLNTKQLLPKAPPTKNQER